MRTLIPFGALCLIAAAAHGEVVRANVYSYKGDGPANLVSNALPLKPGALSDPRNVRVLDRDAEVTIAARVLATWPRDGSIRSLLLQFEAPFGGKSKAYAIHIGAARGTPDRSFIPVTWDLPSKIFTLPPAYISESLIFWEQAPLGKSGFPAWEWKQLEYFTHIAKPGTAGCASQDQYYDAGSTAYQLYARSGRLEHLVVARRWALHHRRDQIRLDGELIGRSRCRDYQKTRYTFPQALARDYFMFGDEEARRVSALVADNFYMVHSSGHYYLSPQTRKFWTEREAAFALVGLLAHYEATGEKRYLDRVRERIAALHRMQVENGRRAWVHNLNDHDPSEGCAPEDWGSSPWMTGLLLEGIVQYHKLTGDPMARESVLMAVDDLRARYLATKGRLAGRSFVYLGCPAHTEGTPDLDNLISHAYGYAYKITGNTEYRALGTALFNSSLQWGRIGNAKQYNQQFRSSGHFVAYLADTRK